MDRQWSPTTGKQRFCVKPWKTNLEQRKQTNSTKSEQEFQQIEKSKKYLSQICFFLLRHFSHLSHSFI